LRAIGEPDAIWEYFKPYEDPDDPESFLGYEMSSFEQLDRQPARTFGPGRNSVY
jgi:hypothetical protein